MNLSFEQELKALIDLVAFKSYRRYGNTLFAEYTHLKPEYTIPEFVWNFCKNPWFAKPLIEELRGCVIDCNEHLKKLANANKVEVDKIHDDWERATSSAFKQPGEIMYSTEYSNKRFACNGLELDEIDGDLWIGLLVTPKFLSNIEKISILIEGRDIENRCVKKIFDYTGKQVVKRCKEIEDSELFIFTPFKHPFILYELKGDVVIDFEFYNSNISLSNERTKGSWDIVFGVTSTQFRKWLGNTSLKLELCNKDKIKFEKGYIQFI